MDFIETELAPITSISGDEFLNDRKESKGSHIASVANTKWVITSAFIFISVVTWVNAIQSFFDLSFNTLKPNKSKIKDDISLNNKYYDFIQQLIFAILITIITIFIYYIFFIKKSYTQK